MNMLYNCEFCEKTFKTESGFIKHKCDKMRRNDEFLTVHGQKSWIYYKLWIQLKHKKTTCNSETFKTSSFFKAFYKFAMFVNKNTIPSTTEFVKLMTRKNISPRFWTTPEAYSQYLNHMAHAVGPDIHISITIKTICNISDSLNIDTSDIFDSLLVNDVIQLLRQHMFSPWVLLNSKKFNRFFVNNTTIEERTIFGALIDSTHWQRKFNENPKIVNTVKKYITELGI